MTKLVLRSYETHVLPGKRNTNNQGRDIEISSSNDDYDTVLDGSEVKYQAPYTTKNENEYTIPLCLWVWV